MVHVPTRCHLQIIRCKSLAAHTYFAQHVVRHDVRHISDLKARGSWPVCNSVGRAFVLGGSSIARAIVSNFGVRDNFHTLRTFLEHGQPISCCMQWLKVFPSSLLRLSGKHKPPQVAYHTTSAHKNSLYRHLLMMHWSRKCGEPSITKDRYCWFGLAISFLHL